MPLTGGGKPSIRIVLADDHTVMRNGLRRLLDDESDFEVVAEAANTSSALQMVRGHRPEVVVLDLNMPGGSMTAAIASIKRFAPHTRIVILSMQAERSLVRAAYEAGADDYVHKEAAPERLIAAIRGNDEGASRSMSGGERR